MQAFVSSLTRLPTAPAPHILRQLRRPRFVPSRFPLRSMATSVAPSLAHKLLEGESAPTYLDVRTPAEFARGHAPTAVNVPITLTLGGSPVPTFVDDVKKVAAPGVPLLVGCKSGKRSTMAINILREAGYEKLTELEGGFDAWLSNSELPVQQ